LEVCFADGSPATKIGLLLVKKMLDAGFILLPEGAHSNVISLTPPLIVSNDQLTRTTAGLQKLLANP
jgi:4-aminobutyrate aminotransferase-like enzyme